MKEEKTILEKLKEDYLIKSNEVSNLHLEYKELNYQLKLAEDKFKTIRKNKNRTYIKYLKSKKELITIQNRLKTKPYQIRRWNKNNIGKILNKMFG